MSKCEPSIWYKYGENVWGAKMAIWGFFTPVLKSFPYMALYGILSKVGSFSPFFAYFYPLSISLKILPTLFSFYLM